MIADLIWGAGVPFAAAAVVAWWCRRLNRRDARRLDRCERFRWGLERHPSRRRTPGLPLDGKPLAPDAKDAEIALLQAVYGMQPAPGVIYEDVPETEGDWG